MTNDFMLKLAQEYMTEMGIAETQFIVVRHHNTDHEHFHIVYNRINNDLKLISVNNDYRRNIAACKKIKNRHGLTYGVGKAKVNRAKLVGADKIKYQIHDEIAANLPKCTNYSDLEKRLQQAGITVHFKYRRSTSESHENVQGVSFSKDGIVFKGSEIDRKFSHANLIKSFARKKNPIIKGVQLTDQQHKTLLNGGHIFLENMIKKDGVGKFSAFAFLNDDKNMVHFSLENPDKFVKYGKYEMRLRDKILIEKGHLTRATVKWWGGGLAHPYLWKTRPSDPNYQESWSDPRLPKTPQEEQNPKTREIPSPKKTPKMKM
jgi:hypothetical protein